MICNVCGNHVDDNSKFCPFCGAPVISVPQQPVQQQAPQQPVQQPVQQQAPTQPVQPTQPNFNQQAPQQPMQQPFQPTQPNFNQQAPQQPVQQPVQPGPQQSFNQQPTQPAPQQNFSQQQQTPQQNFNQQPQGFGGQPTPPKGESKTPLIIAISITAVVFLSLIIGTIIFFNKKKDDDTVAENTTEATEEDTTEATTASPEANTKEDTEEETTEATTEEVIPAYAEENGVSIVPASHVFYSGNGSLVFYDNDDNVVDLDYMDVTKKEYSESVSSVYKTEPDADGNVTYYTQIELIMDAQFTDTKCSLEWSFDLGAWAPDVVDYYSGTVLATPDIANGLIDTDEEKCTTTFDSNGKEVTVDVVRLSDTNSDAYIWDHEQVGNTMNYTYYNNRKLIYVIKAPADYDGLMLAFAEGDVDPDEYLAALEDDGNGDQHKLFEKDSCGFQYDPDQTLCMRLSDEANNNSDDFCNILSTRYVGHPEDSFDWLADYYDGNCEFDRVENSDLLNGTWNVFLWWDKDNENGAYSEEYLNADIFAFEDSIEMKFMYNVQRFSSSGDWRDKSDVEDDYYSGNFDAEGSADFQGEEIESFTMTGFYTDGYVQVGIGKITLTNGETADVFLYRP